MNENDTILINVDAETVQAYNAGFDLLGVGYNVIVPADGPWAGHAVLLSEEETAAVVAVVETVVRPE